MLSSRAPFLQVDKAHQMEQEHQMEQVHLTGGVVLISEEDLLDYWTCQTKIVRLYGKRKCSFMANSFIYLSIVEISLEHLD